jgi:hypothetical protein
MTEKTSATMPGGRRLSVRYPAHAATAGRIALQVGGPSLPARIQNISLGGMNFEIGENVGLDSLLAVELQNCERAASHLVVLRVLRLRPLDDGLWHVAGVFTQMLSPEALRSLV